MSEFRTVVNIPESKHKISHRSGTAFFGSCFSENIGRKLSDLKFSTLINPFGVVYNPVSISKAIYLITEKKVFTDSDIHFYNDQWLSFYHHSSFSNRNKSQCLSNINESINYAHDFLNTAEFLILSFGTSRIYQLKATGEVVSNCHKYPASEFVQKFIEPHELYKESSRMIEILREFNPGLRIIFTISPIRHWKDTPFGNQLNKSSLFLTVNKLLTDYGDTGYFPSYEIMMDELRDYRFYGEDMIHLNKTSVDYIFKRFSENYFTEGTIELNRQIEKILTAFNHRPFNSQSESYKKFAVSNLQLINSLEIKSPGLYFTEEKMFFEKAIIDK